MIGRRRRLTSPVLRGERAISRKPLRRECRSDFGVPVLACVRLFCFARKAVGAFVHPAFPAPSVFERDNVSASLGRENALRGCESVSARFLEMDLSFACPPSPFRLRSGELRRDESGFGVTAFARSLRETEVGLPSRSSRSERRLVPLAGIEPALLAELDFESSASTNSATGAFAGRPEAAVTKPAKYNGRSLRVNPRSAGAGGAKQDTPV